MDHTKMPMNEVLTPDEKLVDGFYKDKNKESTGRYPEAFKRAEC